ncbi:M20/M25/M40 family metallo-hydrolase [Nocardioides jishulii]|uniref:M20/M25/M40 family metallo-hydrolase n=1 Tax=Nocardioides jishulii TaxID=2575440 RepID=A0A4U2YR65_9ACTN|nr:M20/M25/M40 family metallo-hydrolase [Nocardioides jishulii]QCX26338.1 M20/M25/M40 family metallo-hydrolase [Nocardioides jishulii]TKI63858.1 M20/M25/M40 family metallo-hydrolase [Nocardioides jishulii]
MGGVTDSGAISKLQRLVQIPTVSHRDPDLVDHAAFDRLHAALAASYPLLHQHLDLTRVGGHGLLFHWQGASSERPLVLMGHLDVVPVDEDATWTHPAFGGVIADGFLWGRGTLDDKGCVAGICEAVETLLARGFTPAQDVWLSFGANEEVFGTDALDAVALLRERGVAPWLVIDEGGAVAHDAFPGVSCPVAVIGVAEKGSTCFELRAEGRGGHASMPAKMGPTARIARAVMRLERSPFPARLPAPTVELFSRLAPHAPGPLRPLMANAARLAPLLTRALVAAGGESAALARTTVAVTTLSGSPALNVIASTAKAGVNVRIMPGDTVAGVTQHLAKAIRDDHVHLDLVESAEPSPISLHEDDEGFALVERVVAEVFPDAVAAPYVLMGATDSRSFTEICDRVYRFTPFRMSKAQRESIHSYDERIGVDDFADGVRWYERLLESLG